jgi:hypothetical protein
MLPDRPIRVAVALPAGAPVSWHGAVVDAIRAEKNVALCDGPSTDADLVIDLGCSVAASDRGLGVWRYGFGDGAAVADGAAGTWVRLYRITPDPDRAVVLHEGWYRARTREGWGTWSVRHRVAAWCARTLRQILLGDSQLLQRSPQSTAGCRDLQPPERDRNLGRAAVGTVDTVRSWLTRQRWTIGLVPMGIGEILDRGCLPEPVWVEEQPPDRFFADPFLLDVSDRNVRVIAEEYRYRTRTKQLVEIELTRSGRIVHVETPAGLPSAASYPFLYPIGEELYCIPETWTDEHAAAFRRRSAGEWASDRVLLTGFRAVDSTLLQHNGRWWLFCTKQGDEDQTELHLFVAPEWSGPWAPHPLNPVKSDTRSSRPAGACITIDGVVYRPAQNCARRYGAGLTINRIEELSPTSFREVPVVTLKPTSAAWPDGLHTINSLGGLTVVDGLRVERRWAKNQRKVSDTSDTSDTF